MSLDHAPAHADQIPVLFHLAESAQFYLCSETTLLDQPCSYEMKMLQVHARPGPAHYNITKHGSFCHFHYHLFIYTLLLLFIQIFAN